MSFVVQLVLVMPPAEAGGSDDYMGVDDFDALRDPPTAVLDEYNGCAGNVSKMLAIWCGLAREFVAPALVACSAGLLLKGQDLLCVCFAQYLDKPYMNALVQGEYSCKRKAFGWTTT